MSHVRKPLAIAAGLNTTIFAVEIFAGFAGHSNSLLMDGIHNFSDELAMLCLYLAYLLPVTMSKRLQRTANILNSVGIVLISAYVMWHSFTQIDNPSLSTGYIPLTAGIFAALANFGVARVLYRVRGQNAAIRLAYLHNLGDVYVSLAPVLAGFLLLVTGKNFFDPVIAICIGIWFIWSTLKEIFTSYNELIWPENAVCKHDKDVRVQSV